MAAQVLLASAGGTIGGIPLLAIIAALAFLVAILKRDKRAIGGLPVTAKPLMTNAERRAIAHIEAALPGTRVHAQVSMGALMQPRKGLDRSTYFKTFNRFCSKRVDFVVEERATGRILMLIELDDATHNRRSDQDRDRLTTRAGYSTVRLPASERPTAESVRRHIGNALGADSSNPGLPAIGRRPTQAA